MLRRFAPVALAALLLVPAGCGGDDDDAPPAAPPRDRFGAEVVDDMAAVESIRARLSPVAGLVGIGRAGDASIQLRHARRLWSEISQRIRRGDPVLEREVSAAFARVESAVARATSFDAVRDVASPLGAQLLGGVREELVPKDARLDAGVNAAALVELLDRLERAYAAGDRLSFQHSFGLVDRSQSVAREIAGELEPQRGAVIDALKDLRADAFPEGVAVPGEPLPASDLQHRADDIRAALRERFNLR